MPGLAGSQMYGGTDPRLLLGLAGRLLSASGQGMTTGQGLGGAILGGLQDYSSILQEAQVRKRQDLQNELLQKNLDRMAQQEKDEADRKAKFANIMKENPPQYKGLTGITPNTVPSDAFMPGIAGVQPGGYQAAGDAFLPAQGQFGMIDNQAGLAGALKQEALRQAFETGDVRTALAAITPTDDRTTTQKDYEYFLENPEFGQFMQSKTPSTNVTIQNIPEGNIPLGKQAVKDTQKEIIKLQDQVQRIGTLRDRVDPDSLRWGPKFKAWVSSIADKAGIPITDGMANSIGENQRMKTNIMMEFNQYRKEITGAAAALAEIKLLEQSFINQNMAPAQFMTALDEIESRYTLALNLKIKLLQQGINPGTQEFEDMHDKLYMDAIGGSGLESLWSD